jgi:hypothetical protein
MARRRAAAADVAEAVVRDWRLRARDRARRMVCVCVGGGGAGRPGTTSKEEGSREIIAPEMKFVLLVRRITYYYLLRLPYPTLRSSCVAKMKIPLLLQ